MTVYVDDMYRYPMGRFRRMKMSHMIADTEAELHSMADRIGVARRWYQGDHYDICLSLRSRAIALGAVEVTLRQLACMSAVRPKGCHLPPPAQAEEIYLAWREEHRGQERDCSRRPIPVGVDPAA